MEALLELKHLEKNLETFCLHDINLVLEPGYIMGLLGVNGSGKTTLINTILNLYQKDGGSVLIDGISMEEKEKEAKEKIGFVLDKSMFEDNLSVISNGKEFGRLYSKFDESLFRTFCKNFQVPLYKKVGELSLGFKVRFQLAFALSHDAKLFVMDEPASGLDPLFRKELMEYMQEIVEDGTRSVLFSTHITEDLELVGDYVALMEKGKLFLHMTMEELKEYYFLVNGTRKQIESLNFSHIIYREYGQYRNYAFVKKVPSEDYKTFQVQIPSLADIMYCLEKGGYAYV